jgi:hypothetical protein
MTTLFTHIIAALVIGAGATLFVDVWNLGVARMLGIPSLSSCLLGRWVLHMRSGVFRHRAIGSAAAKPFECQTGLMTHYAIGVGLAGTFLLLAPHWLSSPTLGPALLYGVATVAMPFFVMQPALGLGIASAATRRPGQARLKSLATHTAYGVGLYLWGHVAAYFMGR